MKHTIRLLLAVAVLLVSACSIQDEEEKLLGGMKTSKLSVQASVAAYDNAATRAAEWEWIDGDRLYLLFLNSASAVLGHAYATYQKSDGSWTLTYDGNISGTISNCHVYFFDGATTTGSTTVTLGSDVAVYSDNSASFTKTSDGALLTTQLVPATARLRFQRPSGSSVSSISVSGIFYYTSFNLATDAFEIQSDAVNRDVNSATGFTSYVYGLFTDQTNRKLTVTNNVDGEASPFQRSFGSSVMQAGQSGYITIPTSSSSSGWETTANTDKSFTVTSNGKTVTFKMKFVQAGTFQMGSDESSYSAERPGHQVTLTNDYYMGETEVTQALWYAVMGDNTNENGEDLWSTTYGLGDNYPAYNVGYYDCQSFISKLNAMTGETFRMPTEAEWEFAAKGGNSSKGYTYSGSNIIGDVAWYYSNSNSSAHSVKTKQANELGFYDMSGNVYEWCSDRYGSYSSSAQTNPTGPTEGTEYVARGGAWNFDAHSSQSRSRWSLSPTYRDYGLGFRLAYGGASTEITSSTGTENGHDYVDLGLSVRWATTNVGASSPEDYGDYFAWGETTAKSHYSWSTYKYCNGSYDTQTKYCTNSSYGTVDNKTTLESSDDAATVNWGGKWRMPTYDELSELNTKCTWTWTTQNGVNGYKVTGPTATPSSCPLRAIATSRA